MKYIIHTSIIVFIAFLITSCSNSGIPEPIPPTMEEIIVGKEWRLESEGTGFLLESGGSFFLTEACLDNQQRGSWNVEDDKIYNTFIENSLEITQLWGQVNEYTDSLLKLLFYTDSNITILGIYTSASEDIYGCTEATAYNYNPLAMCDDGSCSDVMEGCTDSLASNYNETANTDNESCYYLGCTDSQSANFNTQADTEDGSCLPYIGQTAHGGIVFWIDPNDNSKGMACYLEQMFFTIEAVECYVPPLFLGPMGYFYTGSTPDSYIGSGYNNTMNWIDPIDATIPSPAYYCKMLYTKKEAVGATDGESVMYNDWHLPSLNELVEVKNNISNHPTFTPGNYISSTTIPTTFVAYNEDEGYYDVETFTPIRVSIGENTTDEGVNTIAVRYF